MSTVRNAKLAGFSLVLIGLVFGVLFYLPSTRTTSSSPAFPTKIGGKSVVWIPDEKIRNIAKSVDPLDVESIVLSGGGATGVPGTVTITSRNKIALLLRSFDSAVKLKEPYLLFPSDPGRPIFGGPVYGSILKDYLYINLYPNTPSTRKVTNVIPHFDFYSDVYEGSYPGMSGGAVSPEFQDALRQIGIPKKRMGVYSVQRVQWLFPQ